jgi:DNA-binding NarL/FixJ family response regulator
MTIGVLLADDQPLVRIGLRTLLRAQPDIAVLGEAGDGAAAVTSAARLRPDVVLMDVRMPGIDGIEATRQLSRGDSAPRVLVLTTYDRDEYVFDALAAGASGFLLKDARPEDLIEGIRIVAAGDALLAPSVTRRLIQLFCHSTPVRTPTGTPAGTRSADGRLDRLTGREREVLALVARGLSNAEIGGALHVSDHTVKTHVAHMLAKLGLRDRVHAVIFAYESGLQPVSPYRRNPDAGSA